MNKMNEHQHPAVDPKFDSHGKEEVWYLAHPLAKDEKYSFEENMNHVEHMLRLCFDEGFRVVAPYHTLCRIFDDDNAEHRRIGLETDIRVAYSLGRIILTGHKCSTGMTHELEAVHRRIRHYCGQHAYSGYIESVLHANCIIDLTNMTDVAVRQQLCLWKNG